MSSSMHFFIKHGGVLILLIVITECIQTFIKLFKDENLDENTKKYLKTINASVLKIAIFVVFMIIYFFYQPMNIK